MFKNMKIPVENNLDEIVEELEKKGYVKPNVGGDIVYTSELGNACTFNKDEKGLHELISHYQLTTLAELKEM